MQHDTSPHTVPVGGRTQQLQCASLVLCFSHRKFFQCYPQWNRFMVRVFLTRALAFFEGAAARCMLDNATTIIAYGTGSDAEPAPEMAAFAERFGFRFVAHKPKDAKRSGRVERPFHHIENNFYPGRTFDSLEDLNGQAVQWCNTDNAKFHRYYQAIPDQLYAVERASLGRLPLFVPEPTEVHARKVDTEARAHLHTNRYSAPEELIGADIEVHETYDRVRLFHRHRLLVDHPKAPFGKHKCVTAPVHERRWARLRPAVPSPEELTLRAVDPATALFCDALRKRHGGQALKAMRRLHKFWLDYPDDAFRSAIARAVEFRVVDLTHVENMILTAVRGDFFKLPSTKPEEDENG
ncbi:MAG: IS21 family transposase [Deltaproteobacteria bacterium]|nr:IS21 family transposase [Deltaproteobacteria bacterium]